jgi:stage II sporulation protein P
MFDVEEALDMDLSMKQDNNSPQILIFHTHSQEGFADSIEADASTTIVGVGEYLAELLREQYGYQVIHDTGVYDLVDGKLDRSAAYTYAEKGVESILEKYPSIEVVIDLHRDGVDDANRLVTTVNGKPTAKVMFFNGISYTKVNGALSYLPNPYIEENLAMSLQMKLLGDAYYPGFLRKNYIHGYRYCLHYRAKSMLIEAGAQNNTLEEERNAMEPLAEILHRLLSGEQAYK